MHHLRCFKSYDIRGRVGRDLDAGLARKIGRGFADVMGAKLVVVGRDNRPSSEELARAVAQGLRDAGCDVADIEQCGTEEVYFATDHLGACGGVMVTASHNPIEDNGMKLVGPGARPLSGAEFEAVREHCAGADVAVSGPRGSIHAHDLREAYAARICGMITPENLRPLRVLVNAGHGMAGPAFEAIAAHLPGTWEIIRINHAPDSSFPQGIPNPALPENRVQTEKALREHGADLGIAWDGDCDRCFLFDETGRFVEGEYVTALLARAAIARHPGATVIHDPRVIWAVQDAAQAAGGTAILAPTGHVHLKAALREHGAVYGGEMSGHHYFAEFMACDSGMIPWLMVAALMSASDQPLSELVSEMRAAYPSSGEINFVIEDKPSAMAAFEAAFTQGAKSIERIDGVSIEHSNWRANLRSSNTEALLRLNIETRGDEALLGRKLIEISTLLGGFCHEPRDIDHAV